LEEIVKSVYWTTRSVKDLEKIFLFNTKLFDYNKAIEIVSEIRKSTEILENTLQFDEIGSIDESFIHLKFNYRKLIIHHCKITYRIGKTKIYIVRVFDTRQKPNKNK
jgi:plasmid stabilization system protein ParE